MQRLIALLLALPYMALSVARVRADDPGIEFFERKIRPVLVQHCYSCHSTQAREAKKLQASLYLDLASGVTSGGESGPALVKGNPADSLLLKALKYDGLEMPPEGKLPDEVINDFAKWIEMGAPDPREGQVPQATKREISIEQGKTWWAFQPLKTAALQSPSQPLNLAATIDSLLLEAQRSQQLTHNPPASKDKLIRRAYFDLIGLPPTPEQINTFLKDESPEAFARVIDDLLTSPRYGERWARHWLDVARFAESGGYEFDGFRPGAYRYRDWVINALNEDMPYDHFVRMQLAGDLIEPEDLAAASATGFLVAGPYPGQITAKTVERIRYDQLDDMLMTIGGSMLGLTVGCVRCHEHKYDPIPHQDYYALAASLARTVHGSRMIDEDPIATAAAIETHSREQSAIEAELEDFATSQLPERFTQWRTTELSKHPEATYWQVLEATSHEAERSYLKCLSSGVLASDGEKPPGSTIGQKARGRKVKSEERYRLNFETHQKNLVSLRLDAFTDSKLPNRGPGLNNDGSFQLAEIKVTARPLDAAVKDEPIKLTLKPISAAFEDKDQPLSNAVDNKPGTAWVVRTTAKKDNAAIFEFDKPLAGFAGGTALDVELSFRDAGIGRLRVSVSTVAGPATWAGEISGQHVSEIRAILAANQNKYPPSLAVSMARWFAPFDSATHKMVSAVREHANARPRPKLSEVYTTITGGQDVYYLRRGEVDNKQDKAKPGFIQVLSRTEQAAPTADTGEGIDPRLALANWITDIPSGAGPLLARVIANRVWQHHFGEGLVGTPNDFGVQGEPPAHPEILEALASSLVASGWRLKSLHKQIMLSFAYQQSHDVDADNLKIDPTNRYLWHYRPRRLEAEIIRDALLFAGDNLDLKMYGPSVMDDTLRRSIYLRVKRSELIPQMTMFDAPEPTQSIGERVATTVPTQALAMMNSAFVRQQAEKLRARIHPGKDGSLEQSVQHAYQIVFARQATSHELAIMLEFIAAQRSQLANSSGDEALASALTEFCQVLLCLSEFIYID